MCSFRKAQAGLYDCAQLCDNSAVDAQRGLKPAARLPCKIALGRLVANVTLALSVLMFPLVATSWAREVPQSVKIGVLAKRGPEKCLEKWGPTAEYLTQTIPGC